MELLTMTVMCEGWKTQKTKALENTRVKVVR